MVFAGHYGDSFNTTKEVEINNSKSSFYSLPPSFKKLSTSQAERGDSLTGDGDIDDYQRQLHRRGARGALLGSALSGATESRERSLRLPALRAQKRPRSTGCS